MLGPWVNKPWLNVLAVIIVGALVLLSMILVISTAIPSIDAARLLVVLGSIAGVVLAAICAWILISARRRGVEREPSRSERENWRMPALALLERPRWSTTRRVAMTLLGGYLGLAVILLVVKAIQIATGH